MGEWTRFSGASEDWAQCEEHLVWKTAVCLDRDCPQRGRKQGKGSASLFLAIAVVRRGVGETSRSSASGNHPSHLGKSLHRVVVRESWRLWARSSSASEESAKELGIPFPSLQSFRAQISIETSACVFFRAQLVLCYFLSLELYLFINYLFMFEFKFWFYFCFYCHYQLWDSIPLIEKTA